VAWSGQRIRGRNRLVNWDGCIEIEGGRIVDAEGYAFDSPGEGICAVEERSVSWKSVTTGDADGVVLTLEAGAGAVLRFDSPILRHSLALGELEDGPVELNAGGIDMKVVFEYLPMDLGLEVELSFAEPGLPPGCHPYWVRVLQMDGAKAWSSPIYATVTGPVQVPQ
jgi:hypothetical protein